MPCVATTPMPSSRRRLATTSPAGLSGSASDRNTVPSDGSVGAGGQLGLVERPPERRVDAHHLAGRAHLRTERRVDLGEAGERQHRLLDRHRRRRVRAVQHRRPEQALGAQLGQRRAEHHPGRHLGQRHARRLGHERHRAAGPRVGLDDVHRRAPHRVLHVDQAAHVEALGDRAPCRPRSPRRPTTAGSGAGSRRPSRPSARRPPRRAPSRRR